MTPRENVQSRVNSFAPLGRRNPNFRSIFNLAIESLHQRRACRREISESPPPENAEAVASAVALSFFLVPFLRLSTDLLDKKKYFFLPDFIRLDPSQFPLKYSRLLLFFRVWHFLQHDLLSSLSENPRFHEMSFFSFISSRLCSYSSFLTL